MNIALWGLLIGAVAQVRVAPDEIGPRLAGKPIVVDGVFAGSLTKNRRQYVLLKGCKEAKFLLRDPAAVKLTGNLEIVGTVRLDDNELIVDVASIKALPGDLEQFRAQAQKAGEDPGAWTRLGAWAAERARRYENPALAEQSATAYQTAVKLLRRQAGGDPGRLQRLKEQLAKDPALRELDLVPLEHELLHAEYRRLPRGDAEAKLALVAQIRRRLGLTIGAPARRLDVALERRYDADPIATFDAQPADERLSLVRHWEVAILRQAWDDMYQKKARDPLALAELADREAPDEPEAARHWVRTTVKEFETAPGAFAVSQVEALARLIVRHEQNPQQASQVLLRWLRQREAELEAADRAAAEAARRQGRDGAPRNAKELVSLANLYLKWLQGPGPSAEAARLLIEALSNDPALAVAETTLQRLGYRKDGNGAWRLAAETPNLPPAAPGDAGHLRIGMTADEVRSVMLQPESRARIVTRGDVLHQWVYRLNQVTFYVFLKEERGQLRVTAIKTQK